MTMSNMLRRGLNRITSSVASTAKYGFTRVVCFTGSFNELEPAAPPAQSQEAPAPVTIGAPFDIEAVTPETLASRGSGDGDRGQKPTTQDAEAKRMAKTVQTVCLFAASASLVLFVNLPSKPSGDGAAEHAGAGAVLYSVDMAFICLGLFTSLGLSMFSIVKPSTDPAVARVQKQAMVMAVAFVLVSFTLRMCMMLPAASMESTWLVFVLLAGAVAMYLALTWKFGSGRSAVTASGSAGTASTADRV